MTRKPGSRLDSEQVLRAAAALIDEEGWEQLSLTRLAERLDIRTPSLYNHVASLEQLRRDLRVLGARGLTARLTKAAAGRSGSEAIYAIGHAYRAYAHEHPGLYVAALRAADPDDAEFQAVAREAIELLTTLLEPFGLTEMRALHVVRGLRSLAHGFVSLEAAGGFGLPVNLDESYTFLLRVYIAGLGSDR
jgi:AcrR family transcriptional regulator